jgi:hypothetical protein
VLKDTSLINRKIEQLEKSFSKEILPSCIFSN